MMIFQAKLYFFIKHKFIKLLILLIKVMKTVWITLLFSIVVVIHSPMTSSKELVRGGNLDITEQRLLDIELHHMDLEHEEDLLQALMTKPAVYVTEAVMENAVDPSVYNNQWNEPRDAEDQYMKE